jgi:hypothetical protein
MTSLLTFRFNPPLSTAPNVDGINVLTTNDGGYTYTTTEQPIEIGGFNSNSSLRSVENIPTSVLTLKSLAFNACANLTSITLPSSITTIGPAALAGTSITKITIPSNVTSIGVFAFENCRNLSKITIPSTVTGINNNAFPGITNPATIYTSPLDETNPVYTYFSTASNFSAGQVINITTPPFPPLPIVPCFKSDTKILTINGYVPIQDLRKGDLIKTINHEYVPMNMIGCKTISNSNDDILPNRLFKCSNENYPEITEDLYITGLHSILVDELTQEQEAMVVELFGKKFVTDNKYRLPIFIDKKAKLHEEAGEYTIYHIALDNEHELMNYGIYANGLLAETCCIKYLKDLSNMTLIE